MMTLYVWQARSAFPLGLPVASLAKDRRTASLSSRGPFFGGLLAWPKCNDVVERSWRWSSNGDEAKGQRAPQGST